MAVDVVTDEQALNLVVAEKRAELEAKAAAEAEHEAQDAARVTEVESRRKALADLDALPALPDVQALEAKLRAAEQAAFERGRLYESAGEWLRIAEAELNRFRGIDPDRRPQGA